ncbi:hypothetical protein NMG60_11002656 [Bertholletia excelsa]
MKRLRIHCRTHLSLFDYSNCGRFSITSNATNAVSTNSCVRKKAAMEGAACHGQIVRFGLQVDVLTSNMLINMYSKCGFVDSARKVFNEMTIRSIVSWNTMIGTYIQNGAGEVAFDLFRQMQRQGTHFSEFTVSSILCACAAKSDVFVCKQLHSFSLKVALDLNVFVGTGLLDVYAKNGFLDDAYQVFGQMPERSSVTWTSMIVGYVQHERYDEALVLFHRTQILGLGNNPFIMSSALSACAGLAALIEGKQIQAVVYKSGFDSNIFVASTLIDMYAKCGAIKEAYFVFSNVEGKNVVSWNAMICGFSRHACSLEAMILFEKMQQMGLCPNELTYISMLSVCGHMGFVEQGQKYFGMMLKKHNLSPNVIHYSCMVDVLGRAGLVHEAKDLIDNMPFDATASMWGSLLASCKIHGNIELAEVAATHLFEIEPDNAGNHLLLSNLARNILRESDVKKERGKSWIEVKDKVHEFVAGESTHPRIAEIYSGLEQMIEEMKKLNYRIESEQELHDVEENRKQELLRYHSEKLALIFGLISLPPCAPIRIMKNLRICGDWREIINRFCSCQDFW